MDTRSFGWLQAILYSMGIALWHRYASVAQQIKALGERPLTILDVGAYRGVINEFVNPDEHHLCLLDINAEALKMVGDSRLEAIAGDGCCLPFKDDSFDVVISVESLEHIPELKKAEYCRELKRVARRFVIIYCPADSADGRFQGTTYDVKLLQWYRQRFKKDDPNLMEHLNFRLPKVEELYSYLPVPL